MPSNVDIDKIDTNVRHALGIVELVMDNIGHRVDSSQDSMEYALWSATKHLNEVIDEIAGVGEKNLSKLLSKVDPDPFGEDEEEDEDKDAIVVSLAITKDGTVSLLKDENT